MDEDDCRGAIADCEAEDFARVDEASIQGADGDSVRGDWTVLGIEGDDMEFFLESICGESREAFQAHLDSIIGATDSFWDRRFDIAKDRDTSSKFDSGHDLAVAIGADGFADGAQFVDACVDEFRDGLIFESA